MTKFNTSYLLALENKLWRPMPATSNSSWIDIHNLRVDVLSCMLVAKVVAEHPFLFDLAVTYFDEYLRMFLEEDGTLPVNANKDVKIELLKEKYEFRLVGLCCLRIASAVVRAPESEMYEDEMSELISIDFCLKRVFYDTSSKTFNFSDPSEFDQLFKKLQSSISYDCYANIEKELLYYLDGNLIRPCLYFFIEGGNIDFQKNLRKIPFWSEFSKYKPSIIAEALNCVYSDDFENGDIVLFNDISRSLYGFLTSSDCENKNSPSPKKFEDSFLSTLHPSKKIATNKTFVSGKNQVDIRNCPYDIVHPIRNVSGHTKLNKIRAVTINDNEISKGLYTLKTNVFFYSHTIELACLKLLKDETNIVNLHAFFSKNVRLSPKIERTDLKDIDGRGLNVNGLCLDYGHSTLKSIIEEGRGELFNLKNIFRDVVLGLKACHDNDIIHRDLKPDNILLIHDGTGQGRFVLIDFDNSVPYSSFSSRCGLDPQMASCTILRAPEALFLDTRYDKKIDIWSLGNIFYYVITGQYICEYCETLEDIIFEIVRKFGLPNELEWSNVYSLPFWELPLGQKVLRKLKFNPSILRSKSEDLERKIEESKCKYNEPFFREKLGNFYDVTMKCLTMSPYKRANVDELLKFL